MCKVSHLCDTGKFYESRKCNIISMMRRLRMEPKVLLTMVTQSVQESLSKEGLAIYYCQ